jgi:hypothetical protein
MIVAVPIETRMRPRSPKRNQAARRRVWSLGWVIPKVRKKAVASASKNRIRRWYAVGMGVGRFLVRCRNAGGEEDSGESTAVQEHPI